ncbi:GlyGly-CTERM sorting domain-containing protein [Pseudoalteromonas shioyasakiensis]|nr:GlyGly-CTERM sorting domain-containing protein [Pseudoalteromonas shioyasakiensis]
MSDGEELGCTDSSATNYDESANTDDGSCTFPEAVIPETEVEKDKKSSSGSFGWLLLAVAPLMALRRKKSRIN